MEAAITALAATVTSLFFSEAIKEGGSTLGRATSEQVGKLVSTLAAKIGRKEEDLQYLSRDVFEDQLITVFYQDPKFFNHMQVWIDSIQTEPSIKQILLENAKGKSLTINGVTQKSPIQEGKIEQVIARGVEIDGDISISNASQQ